MLIALILALAAIAYVHARRSTCQHCMRKFAVFSIVGRLRIRVRVCWSCRQRHLRLQRNYAR